MGSSSLTRDWAQVPCIWSTDHQGSPMNAIILTSSSPGGETTPKLETGFPVSPTLALCFVICIRWRMEGLRIHLNKNLLSWEAESFFTCVHAKSLQLCPTLCYPMDCSPQAPLSSCLGFSRQEYRNGLPCPPPDLPIPGIISCIGRQILYHWGSPLLYLSLALSPKDWIPGKLLCVLGRRMQIGAKVITDCFT